MCKLLPGAETSTHNLNLKELFYFKKQAKDNDFEKNNIANAIPGNQDPYLFTKSFFIATKISKSHWQHTEHNFDKI